MSQLKTTYLKFDKTRMVNLEYSLKREVLRTNRRGAYHCTTLVECNTRKQHGLLIVPVPAFNNTNHVLLSSFDETVIQHGAEFNMGLHKYSGDNYSPMGHKYIREFDCDSLPRTIYRVGGVVFSKEKMFSLKSNTIFIRYTLLEAHSPTTMRFRPYLAFREVNSLSSENTDVNHGYEVVENGIKTNLYKGYPDLFMQFNKEPEFVFEPHWYKGVEYPQDMAEGFAAKEDLYVPGYFELPIKKGESIIFSASDQPEDFGRLNIAFEEGIKVRTPRNSFYNCLKNSGHQFYFRPNPNELYILDNYPWGKVDARTQFMALPGLTLCIGKKSEYEEAMDAALPSIRKMLENETVDGYLKDIDTADVALWIIGGLCKFHDDYNKAFYDKYAWIVSDIVDFIFNNKHPDLKVQDNKLLYADGRYYPVSWMNGMCEGKPIVHRTGCLVEINALWYQAVMLNADIAKKQGNKALAEKMDGLAAKIKNSFLETFMNDAGYLYDFVDGGYVDWSVRPNMIIAVAIKYPLLDKWQAKSVIDIVTKELVTPKGIRSLSPKSGGFKPRYEGTLHEKNYASFNGCAWPWLLAPYINAYIKIFKRSGAFFAERSLIGIEEEIANDCIGSLSEIYDGSLPYEGHGAVSSALNVSGILTVLDMKNSYEKLL